MRTLVIVESPNKVKTIQGYLGQGFIVKASIGHVRDLKRTELSVDVNNNFKEEFEIINDPKNPRASKVQVVEGLQKAAKEVDLILLATDPDREGEAISWHLETLLKPYNKNIKRIKFNEITKTSIQKAITQQSDVDIPLVEAQRTRRILDRLVGFLVSGLLQTKIEGNLSAGRVQSAVLRLIKDRDDEIKNFTPEEYWSVFALLNKENSPTESFKAKLSLKDGEKYTPKSEAEFLDIKNQLNGKPFVITKIDKKEESRKPQPPLITSSLQKQSYSTHRLNSEKTMKIAQELFEGIEVNGHRSGLITYMRTDSTSVSEDFRKVTYDFIEGRYGDNYIPVKPNTFSNKENAQEAHECIRPTNIQYVPEEIKQFLTDEQYLVYSLIYNRYLASQMAHAKFDTVNLEIQAENYTFNEKGSMLKFDGFLRHLKGEDFESDKVLPLVNENEVLTLNELTGDQKFTKPPSQFDEGTLIETLEKLGIGRPSTYATIIKTIKARQYIVVSQEKGQKKEYLVITDLGRQVVTELINYFVNLFNLDYTKTMEENLDAIENQKADFIEVLHDFYVGFKKELDDAYANMPVSKAVNYYSKPCPKCNSKLIQKKGQFGEYVECEKFPSCNTRIALTQMEVNYSDIDCPQCKQHKLAIRHNKEKQPFYTCDNESCKPLPYFEKKDIHPEPCDKCGNTMILRKISKDKIFYACLGYYSEHQCRNSRPFIDPKNSKECSECGKPMTKRKGQYGEFWACTGYPTCKHIESVKKKSTAKETDVKCEKCGKPMLLRENKTDKTKKFYGCSGYPSCSHTMPYEKKK